MPKRTPRGQMPPALAERERKRERETAYLRSIGRPVSVPPGPAIEHARKLNGRGMTVQQIADRSGVAKSTIRDLVAGQRTSDKGGYPVRNIPRWAAEAVLGTRYEEPSELGAHFDSTGVRRRLQALALKGFSGVFLSPELGVSKQRLADLAKSRGPVSFAVRKRVIGVYDRFCEASPEGLGISKTSIARTRSFARNNGYIPAHCWDPDTIDDPEAFPEWTGACGTMAGRQIHKREGISLCDACRGAKESSDGEPSGFSPKKFRQARVKAGYAQRKLEHLLGFAEGTISHWEKGRSAPRARNLEKAMSVLDATFEEIYESEN